MSVYLILCICIICVDSCIHYYSQDTEEFHPHEDLFVALYNHMNVLGGFIPNGTKVTTIQMSFWWLDKWWYNWILLSNKKEWTIDMCSNLDEPQVNYAEWIKASLQALHAVWLHLCSILEMTELQMENGFSVVGLGMGKWWERGKCGYKRTKWGILVVMELLTYF